MANNNRWHSICLDSKQNRINYMRWYRNTYAERERLRKQEYYMLHRKEINKRNRLKRLLKKKKEILWIE